MTFFENPGSIVDRSASAFHVLEAIAQIERNLMTPTPRAIQNRTKEWKGRSHSNCMMLENAGLIDSFCVGSNKVFYRLTEAGRDYAKACKS